MSFFNKKTICFMSVAKCRSLKKASEELDVSISLLSKTITSFENQIGHKLFIRKSEGMLLNQDGHSLYEKLICEFNKINRIQSSIALRKSFNVAICGLSEYFIKHLFKNLACNSDQRTFHLSKKQKNDIDLNHSLYDVIYTSEKMDLPYDYFTWCDTLSLLSTNSPNIKNDELHLVQSSDFINTSTFKSHLKALKDKKIEYNLSIIDDSELRLAMVQSGHAETLIPSSFQKIINIGNVNYNKLPINLSFDHYIYFNRTPHGQIKTMEVFLKKNDINWKHNTDGIQLK